MDLFLNFNLGFVIVLVAIFGYVSNFLNWRYLNFRIVRFLYYVGAFVHETSHALLCILTGAKIEEFTVFSDQPRVVHRKSRLLFIGEALISFAPIAGGLLFLFLVNRYLLANYFAPPPLSSWHDWQSIFTGSVNLLSRLDLFRWQSWVAILLFWNIGAMLGPSPRDLKNVWPVLILLFFIKSPILASVGLAALSMIFINIMLQLVLIMLLNFI